MKENWRWQKRHLFSRYNRNLFLKTIEKEKNKYKGRTVKEQNEEENEKDQQRIKEDRKYLKGLKDEGEDMGNLRDLYNEL